MNEIRTPTPERHLAQWPVTWLVGHSSLNSLLWCIDSFVLRNPPLRQVTKRKQANHVQNKKKIHRHKKPLLTIMFRLLYLILLLPTCAFGQPAKSPTKADLTKTYSRAIGDFIKTANKKNKISFDTLFFGKRINGQPDDFPDIELPKAIEKVQLKLITPEAGEKSQKQRKSRIYINLIGWVNKDHAEFIFVVFSNGFAHQYDYKLNYEYNAQKKELELKKIQFKGPPFNQWQ